MAATAAASTMARVVRRKPCWTGTPEVYFAKNIDNSRVVRVADPRRTREMAMFLVAVCCLFALVMTYAWQHFSAIEYGYRIEALQAQKAGLLEINHALRLEDASLHDPGRIDQLARQMGLQSPTAGQVIMLDTALPDPSAPQMASVANPVAVVSAR
jgi:cell division protein FtsL